MNDIFKTYRKLFSLLTCFSFMAIGTLFIKYYFKPFIFMVIMIMICTPIYILMTKVKVPEKIAGALSIIIINIIVILIGIYLGSEIFALVRKIYIANLKEINEFIQDISVILNIDFSSLKIGKSVVSIINDQNIRQGAINTGDGILAYFIGNICTFFVLIDKEKIVELISKLLPKEIMYKFSNQKNNFIQMVGIEIILAFISTLEIIVGFFILNVPNFFMLGVICGILDILPYVGTVIVFIPIIIYNIIMKKYIIAFGLMCVYVLVQIVREILEAKFLGDKLDIHPLVILLSIYIGIKIFGVLGIVVGPMYSILAKEIIYNAEYDY